MVWKRERAIASCLLIIKSVAERYGNPFILRDLPGRVYVEGMGRDIALSSLKRYVDYVWEWCCRNGVADCPIRKEYVVREGNRFLKVHVDVGRAVEVAEELVGAAELRRRERRELRDELRKCRESLRVCGNELRALRRKLEEVEGRIKELEDEVTSLRSKAGHGIKDFIRDFLLFLSDDAKLIKCVEGLNTAKHVGMECALLIAVLDTVTTVIKGDESLADIFVDRYEESRKYRKAVRKLRNQLREGKLQQ